MFGCTVFHRWVVDVKRDSPGQQELRLRGIGNRRGQIPSAGRGSHQKFWDLYYKAVKPLTPMVDPHHAAILSPISGDPIWQIQRRNDINYHTNNGFRLAQDFGARFSQHGFPGSLPGILATQYGILEDLLELVFSFATGFGLTTDALDGLGSSGGLRHKVKELVYQDRPPGLVRKTRKQAIC
jgi:hypothetical protein